MRQNYPVTSQEMLVELHDLQETLISLIGYDSNSFDNLVDISGVVGSMEDSVLQSNTEFLNTRLYKEGNPDYSSIYRDAFVLSIVRRSINA